MERAKAIRYALITAAGIGAAVGTYFLVRGIRRRRTKESVETLLDLFQKEGELSQSEIDRLRFIFDIENYRLPSYLQNALDDNRILIKKAVDAFKQKDVNAYFYYIAQVKSKLPANIIPDFEYATSMAYDVVRKTNGFKDDSNSLFSKLRNSITPKPKMLAFLGEYAYVLSPLAGILVPRYVEYKQNVENNPAYTIVRDLYANQNVSKNRLKLFDEIWKIYSGKPFFVSEIKNVKA